jgi:hypothetical protein
MLYSWMHFGLSNFCIFWDDICFPLPHWYQILMHCMSNQTFIPGINTPYHSLLVFVFSLYCYDVWGYIVAFTKVITMYQIYCTWIHLLNHSPSSSSPPIPGVVSTGIIFAFRYMCTYFIAPHSPSYPCSSIPPHSHWCQPSRVGRTCSTCLFSSFLE